jgi:Mg/Co/Ni transporter MgtE
LGEARSDAFGGVAAPTRSRPLILKRLRIDPALVAGPILMTLADACGFFFALSFATVMSERLRM